ncbi:hypothetical protein BACCIP111895_00869 [Neobacillus rhizosphaerae]|uniref:Uncharacterized protein n=1 Tax=Neobacillus rhizosphaerae TaxID=2880965 RepID=A0ABN8KLL1_9BACI|nr:hypothetical protein [Neobacillus rhizosphaerae]CAH2713715.1 hypothetical protein BACCIP111895_00869 [Neobacillus rhizosphaerae]
MSYPISIFILDVSNSSSDGIGDELANYLDELVTWNTIWTEKLKPIHIKHRAGDEIIFVGSGYSTAYILAFFVSRIWKYRNHNPYFGLSFGDIDKHLHDIDIEKWIHPLIKQARYANDLLKQDQKRPLFKFELDQFYSGNPDNPFLYNQFRNEFETLLNTLLYIQHTLIKEQTKIQELVCSSYLILQQQKAVGEFLGKTPPTISSHYKKGKCEEILHTFTEIMKTLNSLEKKTYHTLRVNPNEASGILLDSIRSHLKENINTLHSI